VKIYENLDVLPRLFFAPRAIRVGDDHGAIVAMQAPDFDPSTTVVLIGQGSANDASGAPASADLAAEQATTQLLLYEPERVVATVDVPTDGWLLLSDAWYPGWQAMVDSSPAAMERADILFRAVAVPAGKHRVEWVFRPTSFRLGAVVTLCAIGLLLAGVVVFLLAEKMTGKLGSPFF
jgi:hypothetical protein